MPFLARKYGTFMGIIGRLLHARNVFRGKLLHFCRCVEAVETEVLSVVDMNDQTAYNGPKLLDELRTALRMKHYSYRTEQSYVYWARGYILFHNKKHPKLMGACEVRTFCSHLAEKEHVSASTQNQAVQLAGITKHAGCHTFRHSFATHVMNRPGIHVRSPADTFGK